MGIFDSAKVHVYTKLDPYGYRKVYITFPDGRKYYTKYARYLMEHHLDKILPTNVHVHHKDGVRDNDVITNLELITKEEHKRNHNLHLKSQEFVCPVCGAKFALDGTRLSQVLYQNRKYPNRKGPFCSKSCANSNVGRASTPMLRSGLKQEYYVPCRGE